MVRVRFAPAPTGQLHLGGLRAALFNWLFARHYGGRFLLRIEDTDVERSKEEYTKSILDSLAWCLLTSDEPVVIQSQRISLYQKIVEQLIAQGHAYKCYCSAEQLEKRLGIKEDSEGTQYDKWCRSTQEQPGASYVIRFKIPDNQKSITFVDLIRDTITIELDQLDDFIIVRSDGSFMYNFCAVVDDASMGITHVIRGEEHIPNTPKQILLYTACNYAIPQFAHLPLILGPDGNKLSKRDAATAVLDYKQQGFLPDALCNYLVRLGWSYGDQEIFTRDELITLFSIDNVHKKGAIFDIKKLAWMNGIYIRQTSSQDLLEYIITQFDSAFLTYFSTWSSEKVRFAISLYQARVKTIKELCDELRVLYDGPQGLKAETLHGELLSKFIDNLKNIDEAHWSIDNLSVLGKQFCEYNGLKLPDLATPLRMALLGKTGGPGIYELLAFLGKTASIARIEIFLKFL